MKNNDKKLIEIKEVNFNILNKERNDNILKNIKIKESITSEGNIDVSLTDKRNKRKNNDPMIEDISTVRERMTKK